MKKILSLLVLVMATMFVSNADAQIKFGVKGGLNVTNMSLSKDVLETSNRTGFFIGPTVKFTLPIVGLGVDAAALYDQRDGKVDDTTVKQKSINVPVNLRYSLGLGDLAGIYFAAGPQFGFNVGDDNYSWTNSKSLQNTFQIKKSNFSINLGAGVTLLKHLEIGAAYNIVCGKTGEIDVVDVSKNVTTNARSRYNSWQISAAYYF
jgi:hypothetical protein